MTPVRKANGEHVDTTPAATRYQQEPELPGVDSIIDGMPGRSTGHDQEVLQVLLRVATGQERIIAQQDKALAQQDLLIRALADGKNGNGKKWWVAPVVAGLVAVGGMFGIQYVPKAQSETDKQVALVLGKLAQHEDDHQKLEKLRTLYLIRFGEDPDVVDPQTMKKPTQRR